MEYVEAMLYHKILNSDFTNMYEVKKYIGGNGQTYIQAAGYTYQELDQMFADADTIKNTLEYWDTELERPKKKYIFSAKAIGQNQAAEIELAPRTGRKDYRICRQNIKNRHPAWSATAGFPEPRRVNTASGSWYQYEKNYGGLIDHLFIYIIKTVSDDGKKKFYASYIDSDKLPDSWPSGLGLENIFDKKMRQGILFFNGQYIRFTNKQDCPFAVGCAADGEIGYAELPLDLANMTEDAVEYAGREVDIQIDKKRILFREVDAPLLKRKPKRASGMKIRKSVDYLRGEKNKKRIGDIGEELVIELERAHLTELGRKDLADKIRHVSKTNGDGWGYDILSFDITEDGVYEKYIEVKATTGNIEKPFDITANEVEMSERYGEHYYIYRLFQIRHNMPVLSYYVINGSVKEHFLLEPTVFKAYPVEREKSDHHL